MDYRPNDAFWDIESLENIYVDAFYYPHTNTIDYHFIDNTGFGLATEPVQKKFKERFYQFFRKHDFINKDTQVNLYNMETKDGLFHYLKTIGLSFAQSQFDLNQTKHDEKYKLLKQYFGDKARELVLIKDTDTLYNRDLHGYRFGYNAFNYDETMTSDIAAHFLYALEGQDLDQLKDIPAIELLPDAGRIRTVNDTLFRDDMIDNMPSYARQDKNGAAIIKQGFQLSGRYIDVARLNEKMSRIALKRIFAMMGLTIKEVQLEDRVKSLNELIELLVYNASDTVNLRHVFESKHYIVPFNQRNELLKRYPQVIYKAKEGSLSEPDVSPTTVRSDRLNAASTSAKFVELITSPYNSLVDDEVVNFDYPSKETCERLSKELGRKIEPTDILEDTKKWFEKHITSDPEHPAHKDFMRIYYYFDGIRGSNFNHGRNYQNYYGPIHPDLQRDKKNAQGFYDKLHKNRQDINQLHDQFNTNICYFDKDGNPTAGYVTFAVGGIHGAAYNKKLYDRDCEVAAKHNKTIDAIRKVYPNVSDLIIKGEKRNLFDKEAKVLVDGQLLLKNDIKKFIKNLRITPKGNDVKEEDYGTWKYMTLPSLWSIKRDKDTKLKTYKLNPRYTWTFTGKANHEDFASYYPLLISQISAFKNEELGKDNYYGLYLTRLKEKDKLKDKSLSNAKKDLANLTQLLMKLLINAGSGVGDATFDTNLRVNNRIMKMRIIG